MVELLALGTGEFHFLQALEQCGHAEEGYLDLIPYILSLSVAFLLRMGLWNECIL